MPESQILTAAAPPLHVYLHRVKGRKVRAEAVPLPELGCVLGSEGLLGETLGSGLFVAHRHAQIMPLCGHWMLLPADADMVCVFNGKKMPWGEPQALGAGDSVQLGFTEWRFVLPQAPSFSDFDPASVHEAHGLPDPLPDPFADSLADTLSPSQCDFLSDLLPASSTDTGAELWPQKSSPFPAPLLPPSLPPEEALMAQLAEDFAVSPASQALLYAPGQRLDAILSPAPDAERAMTAQAEPQDHKDFFQQLSQPLQGASLVPPLQTLPGALFSDKALNDPAWLASPSQPSCSLEEIVDGPLNIDDVLRSLAAQPADVPQSGPLLWPLAEPLSPLPGLDALENEIPPDPLLLLDIAEGTRHQPPPAWAASHDTLSPLLGREHHNPGIHSAYSPGGQQHSSARPSRPTLASEDS